MPPPGVKSFKRWYGKFKNTGGVEDLKRTRRTETNDDSVDAVRPAFQQNSRKSTRRASTKLGVPQSRGSQKLFGATQKVFALNSRDPKI